MKTERIGFEINDLRVADKADPHISKSGRPYPQVKMECFCGKTKVVSWDELKQGRIKSCGCLSKKRVDRKIGFKANGLEVIAIAPSRRYISPSGIYAGKIRHASRVIVKCFCGGTKTVGWATFSRGGIKSCGCKKHPGNRLGKFTRRYGADSPHWKGHGEISKQFWNHIVDGAHHRSLEINVTIQNVWDLFVKQNRKCALTGEDLVFAQTVKQQRAGLTTASLDRIDSTKGYVEGNIQWVHKTINLLKMQLPQEDFVRWCKKVVTHTAA